MLYNALVISQVLLGPILVLISEFYLGHIQYLSLYIFVTKTCYCLKIPNLQDT